MRIKTRRSITGEASVRFDNKVVVVTGGASGIGCATAQRFAELGATVVIADINQSNSEETVALIRRDGGKASAFAADMTNSGGVTGLFDEVVRQFGKIDVLYLNAGIQGAVGPIYSYDEAEFDRVQAINTKGVFLGLRHALPIMIKQASGSVVVTCSIASLGGIPNLPAYVASKHGALGLVRSAAMDVARFGVRVNGVCPGAVDTPMLAEVLQKLSPGAPAAGAARFAASAPTGRLVTADEIADTVVFLCSESARSITGAHFVVDGGLSAAVGSATRPPS